MRLGIDFGTCFSSAAVLLDGKLEMVKDPSTLSFSLPSSVYITPQGEAVVGRHADQQRSRDPSRYRHEFKRDLDNGGEPLLLGDKRLRPDELVALVLGKLKSQADAMVTARGFPALTDAVITVPAKYQDYLRGLMKRAGETAGFTQVDLLDEPVAAAIGYAQRGSMAGEERVLVYDLGGGTFDTAILKRNGDSYDFVGLPDGIARCGGIDFDRELFKHLLSQGSPEVRALVQRQDEAALLARAAIWDQCVALKHQLSEVSEAEVTFMVPGSGAVERYRLTRAAFNQLIEPFVRETLACCRRMLAQANQPIDRVLLVGGSCRIPYVRERVQQEFGKPVLAADDLELIVCQGAALYGAARQADDAQIIVAPEPGAGQFTSIADALAKGRLHVPILVRPGTYRESLTLARGVEISGDGPAEQIIIEALNAPCVTMQTDHATVRGLTLRRLAPLGAQGGPAGDAGAPREQSRMQGAAVAQTRGRLVLEDCVISSAGDGVVVEGTAATSILRHCRIRGCKKNGLAVAENAHTQLDDCEFGNNVVGVLISDGANPTLRRCAIHDSSGNGVMVKDQSQGLLEDCDIYQNAWPGVGIRGGANPTLRRCKLRDGTNAGASISDAKGNFEACDISGNAMVGVQIHGNADPVLRKCKLHDNTQNGVLAKDGGKGTIEDCEVYANAMAGIAITTAGNPTVRRGTFRNGKNVGLAVLDNGLGIIEDCEFTANTGTAIQVTKGGKPTVRRCTIHDEPGNGIKVADQGAGEFENCDIASTASTAIHCESSGNPTIRKCKVHESKGNGINVVNKGQGTFEDCDIYKNVMPNVGISDSANPTLRRCAIHDGQSDGIVIRTKGQGTFEDCDIYKNALVGVEVVEGGNPTLRNCKVRDGKGAGISVFGAGSTGSFYDCTVSGNGDGGWLVEAGRTITRPSPASIYDKLKSLLEAKKWAEADTESVRILQSVCGHTVLNSSARAHAIPDIVLQVLNNMWKHAGGGELKDRQWANSLTPFNQFLAWYSFDTWISKRLKEMGLKPA